MRQPEAHGIFHAADGRMRAQLAVGGAALGAATILLLLWRSAGSIPAAGMHRKLPRLAWGRARGLACALQPLGYEPSAWEQEWLDNAEAYQERPCALMLEQADRVDAWMGPMNASYAPGVVASAMPAMQGSEVFSHFVYRDSCSGKTVRAPIEPLVGVLRHPTSECRRPNGPDFVDMAHDTPHDQRVVRAWCARHPEVDCQKNPPKHRRMIENKGYMVIQPLPVDMVARVYPGRKYLFDLGTGRFSSGSLPWFLSIFAAKGIEFDEIWGWEVTLQDPEEYWNEWPPKIRSMMHFRNTACSVAADDPGNPLNILRRVYRPGDYVAFKLDIDNVPLEQALLNQLDKPTAGMIAEFFTEIHFNNTDMRTFFGRNHTVTLPDVIYQLHDFRPRGLRIHYWP